MHYQDIRNSSQITKAGYDPETKTLRIIFNRGAEYEYENVPIAIYTQLIGLQGGAGKFFNENIKGKFTHRKLEKGGR